MTLSFAYIIWRDGEHYAAGTYTRKEIIPKETIMAILQSKEKCFPQIKNAKRRRRFLFIPAKCCE